MLILLNKIYTKKPSAMNWIKEYMHMFPEEKKKLVQSITTKKGGGERIL